MNLYELAADRILIMDGAMGTMIQKLGLSENDFRGTRFAEYDVPLKGNNDLLSITQPQAIIDIHLQYLRAGAHIIETNTFSSQSVSQADYNLAHQAYELNLASAQCARKAIDLFNAENSDAEARFVAGAIGPTNKMLSMSPRVNEPHYRAISFDELCTAYKTQIEGLIDGGVDILLIETVFDTLNAKAALVAASEVFAKKNIQLPVMVSGTITDAAGRTLSGQTVEAFLISLSYYPLFSVGFNCALGAGQLLPYIKSLARISPFRISVYPNAGLPNELGNYDQSAEIMAQLVQPYLEQQLVNIVGGCCGTTPAHIQQLSKLAGRYKPRVTDYAAASFS